MGYLRPTDGRTLSSRTAHTRRVPPSQEAGTDISCDFGTPLRAPAAGRVYAVAGGTGPATGYYVTIDLDDGRRVRYLHLWDRFVVPGQRVSRGDIFALSGGSGYGSMTAAGGAGTVGRHVHVTLWPAHEYSFGSNANTLDFEQYADPIGSPATGGSSTPFDLEDFMSALTDAEQRELYNNICRGGQRDLAKIFADVLLDYGIARNGGGFGGVTTPRSFFAYADNNNIGIEQRLTERIELKAHDLANHVTNAVAASAGIDPEVIREAVSKAVAEGFEKFQDADAEAVADRVAAEFADRLKNPGNPG